MISTARWRDRARRSPGRRDSFLGKRQAGVWRNHCNREAAEIFDRYGCAGLIEAGYEKARSWIDLCATD